MYCLEQHNDVTYRLTELNLDISETSELLLYIVKAFHVMPVICRLVGYLSLTKQQNGNAKITQ